MILGTSGCVHSARRPSADLAAGGCVVIVAATVFVATWLLAGIHHETKVDRLGFAVLALSRHGAVARVVASTVVAGEVTVVAVTLSAVVALWLVGARRDVAAIIAGLAACDLAAHVAKVSIARPRPSGALVHAGGFSFPSSTSALCVVFVAIAMAFASCASKRRTKTITVSAGCALTVLFGLLFVALRVHYLTDVIGGWAFGAVVFGTCISVGTIIPSMMGSARP
jgi:undecaprenyl-diphosphatase